MYDAEKAEKKEIIIYFITAFIVLGILTYMFLSQIPTTSSMIERWTSAFHTFI